MELLLSLAIGIGLAAAVGFRIFVPFTVISLAAMSGHLTLADGFAWMGTPPALLLFGTATVVEIAAYYVPWLDNLLDAAATPVAVVAGAVATASVVGEMSPMMRWVLAAIVGGGMAAAVQSATVMLRGGSSLTTAGAGNFVVASAELLGAVLTALAAIWLPLAGVGLIVVLIVWRIVGARRRRAPADLYGEGLSGRT